jgi:flagellar assembly protein FliH
VVDKNRIPAADSREFSSWSLPEVVAGHVVAVAPEPAAREPESEIVARAVTARQLEELTSQAQREGHAQGLQEGRAEGIERGLEEGRAQARVELQQQVEQLQKVMAQLLAPIAAQQEDIEAALTRLALDIARAALDREPALAPEQLLPVVRAALRELPVGERNITVLLHPQQLALVREYAAWPAAWNVAADERVERGACRIETEHSLVDYTVGLRFRQVAAQLLAEHANAPAPEPGTLMGEDEHD